MLKVLSPFLLTDALIQSVLTDSRHELHAKQILVGENHDALAKHGQCNWQLVLNCPVVPQEYNYDRLGYPSDGAARDERYTHYVSDQLILRTWTSSVAPDLLSGLHVDPPKDLHLILPGLVYLRDCIDWLHCAERDKLVLR